MSAHVPDLNLQMEPPSVVSPETLTVSQHLLLLQGQSMSAHVLDLNQQMGPTLQGQSPATLRLRHQPLLQGRPMLQSSLDLNPLTVLLFAVPLMDAGSPQTGLSP